MSGRTAAKSIVPFRHPGRGRASTFENADLCLAHGFSSETIALTDSFPPSDHFDGRLFFNPGVNTDKTRQDLRRWRRERKAPLWPPRVCNAPFPPPPAAVDGPSVALTYIGQATVLVQLAGLNILTDPIFSERASPFGWIGPKRVRAPGVAFDDLPRIDIVLLSHDHYDHMDLPSLKRLRDRWAPLVVTGLGNGRRLTGRRIGPSVELDWWQQSRPHPDLEITFVPAQHWSRRGLFDHRRTLWGGHVLTTRHRRVFFAGDTGYPANFREIAARLGPPDLALLPIGAYEPRWFMAKQHMNPDDAVMAHRDLQAKRSVAIHFGTFPLTDEAMDAPAETLGAARSRHGIAADEFIVPDFGKTLFF